MKRLLAKPAAIGIKRYFLKCQVLISASLVAGLLLTGCSAGNAVSGNDENTGTVENSENVGKGTENMIGSNNMGKYNLKYEGFGFNSEKTTYAEGEEVTVYYGMIATDTDYYFSLDCDDVELNRSYDSAKGYVFTFVMPAHDVTLSVESRNTMVNQSAVSGGWSWGN